MVESNSQSPSTSLINRNSETPRTKHTKMKFGKSAKLSVQLILTFGYFLAEIIVGYQNSAMSLVADSFHMLSDVLAIFVGIVAVRLKKKQATNDKYSFGYKRAEVAGALCNAVFLLALCFVIIVEAVQRFIEPEHMRDAKLVFIVGTIGLAVNVVGLMMFWEEGGHGHSHGGGSGHSHGNDSGHGHSHENTSYDDKTSENKTYSETNIDTEVGHGHSHEQSTEKSKYNMNMHGVWLHVLGDALGSVVVMIAAGLIWYVEVAILSTPTISSEDILARQNSTNFTFNQICQPASINQTRYSNSTSNSCINPTIQDLEEFLETYKTERMFPEKNFWWFVYNYADPLLSVIITVIILLSTIPLAKESLKIILQARPDNLSLNLKDLQKEIAEKVGANINLHHLHAWALSSDTTIASLHMKVPAEIDIYHRAVAALREKLCNNYQLHHLTIEPEFEDLNSSFTNGRSDNFNACKAEECCGDTQKNGPPCGLQT